MSFKNKLKCKDQAISNSKASLKPQKYQLTPQQELLDLIALRVRTEAEQLYHYLKGERARLQTKKEKHQQERDWRKGERGSSYQGIKEESKGPASDYCSKSRPQCGLRASTETAWIQKPVRRL